MGRDQQGPEAAGGPTVPLPTWVMPLPLALGGPRRSAARVSHASLPSRVSSRSRPLHGGPRSGGLCVSCSLENLPAGLEGGWSPLDLA